MLEKHLKRLVGSYKNFGKFGVASWCSFNDDFSLERWENNGPCHYSLRTYKPGYQTLITAVPYATPENLAFLRALIAGPFKNYKDLIRLERWKPRGRYWVIYCDHLEQWPANVLYNFCIATRQTIEFHDDIKHWAEMVEDGVDPNVAIALMGFYYRGRDKKLAHKANFSGHFYLDHNTNMFNVVAGHMPKKSKASFFDNPSECTPSNMLWGKWDQIWCNKLNGMTVFEAQEYLLKGAHEQAA